jgi:5-formyltetrahydrofolate cyclo-ligase
MIFGRTREFQKGRFSKRSVRWDLMTSKSPDIEKLHEAKEEIRRKVWNRLTQADVARPPLPIRGRIPNFAGADHAAHRLQQLPVFDDWKLVFCNPDSPQRPLRLRLLEAGKQIIMATPRLKKGFLILNPNKLPQTLYPRAATIRGAFDLGIRIAEPTESIDAKIMGSVAVDQWGGRIGKGGGYSDLECSILTELGLIDEKIPTVTTVHDLQIIDERLLMASHDMPVDIVVTPTRHFHTHTEYPRPKKIDWSIVSQKRRSEIAWPPSIALPSSEENLS